MELRKSERRRAKIKVALQGPAGAGKTYSALLMAYGLVEDWRKVAVIDTEHGSADLYAHLGEYKVLTLSQPFSPQRFIEAIEVCEAAGMEVIIIDSLSSEWAGEGGILDVHGKMTGNSFANWSKVLPTHNLLIQKLVGLSTHVIGSFRSKQDYVLSDKNGKMVPEKVGLKAIARDETDYEFSIVFDIDINHITRITKDRTGIFINQLPFKISANTGKRIRKWCEMEITEAQLLEMLKEAQTEEGLKELYKRHPQFQVNLRTQFQQRWKSVIQSNIPQNGTASKN